MQKQSAATNKSAASGPMFSSSVRSMESNHKPLVILRCKLVIVG